MRMLLGNPARPIPACAGRGSIEVGAVPAHRSGSPRPSHSKPTTELRHPRRRASTSHGAAIEASYPEPGPKAGPVAGELKRILPTEELKHPVRRQKNGGSTRASSTTWSPTTATGTLQPSPPPRPAAPSARRRPSRLSDGRRGRVDVGPPAGMPSGRLLPSLCAGGGGSVPGPRRTKETVAVRSATAPFPSVSPPCRRRWLGHHAPLV